MAGAELIGSEVTPRRRAPARCRGPFFVRVKLHGCQASWLASVMDSHMMIGWSKGGIGETFRGGLGVLLGLMP